MRKGIVGAMVSLASMMITQMHNKRVIETEKAGVEFKRPVTVRYNYTTGSFGNGRGVGRTKKHNRLHYSRRAKIARRRAVNQR